MTGERIRRNEEPGLWERVKWMTFDLIPYLDVVAFIVFLAVLLGVIAGSVWGFI